MTLRNLFGRAEHLQVISMTAFPHWGQTIRVEFSKPHYTNIERKYIVYNNVFILIYLLDLMQVLLQLVIKNHLVVFNNI